MLFCPSWLINFSLNLISSLQENENWKMPVECELFPFPYLFRQWLRTFISRLCLCLALKFTDRKCPRWMLLLNVQDECYYLICAGKCYKYYFTSLNYIMCILVGLKLLPWYLEKLEHAFISIWWEQSWFQTCVLKSLVRTMIIHVVNNCPIT